MDEPLYVYEVSYSQDNFPAESKTGIASSPEEMINKAQAWFGRERMDNVEITSVIKTAEVTIR